jgi:hypothetical protein
VVAREAALLLQQPAKRLVGTKGPEQSQETNDRGLANGGEAIDHEGDSAANHGCLDEIGHMHTTTTSFLTGPRAATVWHLPASAALLGTKNIFTRFSKDASCFALQWQMGQAGLAVLN